MKFLVGPVVAMMMACTGGDTAAMPDAGADAAPTVDAQPAPMCSPAPTPYQVSVTYNGDGTVTMSTDDYGKIQHFLDYTLQWAGCETR